MTPVETGNALLDLNQNLTNEWESRMRREEALLRSTLKVLRGTPELWAVSTILLIPRVTLIILAAAGVTMLTSSVDDPFTRVIVGGPLVFVALALLLAFMPIFNLLVFGASTSGGLRRLDDRRGSVPRLLADAVGAWRLLGRLALAKVLGLLGALYEALMVFVVPVAISEGLGYKAAQRRSEELVELRWGPGRFRALGIPRMVPANAAYSFLVRRFGYRGVFIEVAVVLIVLLIPVAIVLITRSIWAFLMAGILAWGPLVVALLVWGWLIQPVLDGLLRAHLYRYAVTGEASAPYSTALLHACLREELRAKFGKPQRGSEVGLPDVEDNSGLPGVLDRLKAGGSGSVGVEAGMTTHDLRRVAEGVKDLWSDCRVVMRVVRSRGGHGVARDVVIAETGLPPPRCDAAIKNLVDIGHLEDAAGRGGIVEYVPTRLRRSWWEPR